MLASHISGLVNDAIRAVFPDACVICHSDHAAESLTGRAAGDWLWICESCETQMIGDLTWRCPYCHTSRPQGVRGDLRCHRCRTANLHFERVIAVGHYTGILRDSVLEMKAQVNDIMAVNFGRLLGRVW
ncbi:MAG TPA: hypothetical protein PKD54_00340, partial [Pirellulaceae bacterium]|nr:hypothetical protein [Pirellulaceae bacterium]